jgi:Zn-dependent M28 family amino/carboxypeptidase
MPVLSVESQWHEQLARQRLIIRIMLIGLLVFLLLLVALWFWLTQPLLLNSTPNANRTVEPLRLETHVRKLSVELIPRDEGHIENLDRVAAYIKEQFQQTGARVIEQPYRIEGKSYRNVIAQFGPENGERIIIGAHYDTAGPLPGADDNASGVAGLIELAQLLSKQQLQTRVDLVAFTLEEPPYFGTNGMGSAVHADSLRKENVDVRLMISLEMIGYFSDAANSQRFPASFLKLFYPSTGNYIAVVGRLSDGLVVRRVKSMMRGATPLPVYSISAPRVIPGVDFSDQLNYWNVGYPAVMITDTAFYRNRNYHTEHDTAEKLDYKRMAMVVEGVFAAVMEISK